MMSKKIIKFVLTILLFSSILISCKGFIWGGKIEDITENLYVTYTFYADSSKTESTQRKYLVGEKYEFPSADKELLKELGKAGYEPSGWIFIPSEEEPETPDTLVLKDGYVKEFTASFIERSFYADGWDAIPSNYTIKYMVENAENNEYTLHSEEVVVSYEHCVIRKEDIDPYIKEIEHFTYDPLRLVVPEEIEPDNKTVVNLYYKRNLETVIVDLDGGTTDTTLKELTDGTYEYTGKYGSIIKIDTPVKEKFEFQYWVDSANTPISETLLYCGSVDFIKAHYASLNQGSGAVADPLDVVKNLYFSLSGINVEKSDGVYSVRLGDLLALTVTDRTTHNAVSNITITDWSATAVYAGIEEIEVTLNNVTGETCKKTFTLESSRYYPGTYVFKVCGRYNSVPFSTEFIVQVTE